MTDAVHRIVLENATIVTHDAVVARPLTFFGKRIAPPLQNSYPIDLRDHLVYPGLINAHDHLQLNNIPRLPHVAPFANSYEWIEAFELYRPGAAVAAAVAVPSNVRHWHGGLKNLLAGATTVAHHDPRNAAFDSPDFPVGLLTEFGWSHSLGLGESTGGRPPKYGPPVYESFITTSRWEPWIIHLAEGVDAIAHAETARLDDLGCLACNTVIVHGVGMSAEDLGRVIVHDVSVVWCPSSNLEMFDKTLDPRRLFTANLVTLGTDSRLTGSRDLLDELRVAAANSDLSAKELLRLVTVDASQILRMPLCGGLEVGQKNDCVILRAGSDPYDTLLDTNRSEIRAVVRGGVPMIADPDFAQWFAHCGVETIEVTLDGYPKLLARSLARADAVSLELGLEFAQ